jgi:prolycopene isomerase
LRNKTFKDLLDSYFEDYKLKAVLSLPVLGNVGLPPSLVSAITAATIYKEYIYDGGNYFEGGMQKLPNILVKKLKELGGDVILSKLVKKIKINDNLVKGIILEDNNFISAKYVVSNVDTRYTFLEMLNSNSTDKNVLDKLNGMTPSLSMFILYLGIDQNFSGFPEIPSNIWCLPDYDIERMYLTAMKGDVDNSDWFLFRASKDKRNILMLVNASFNTEKFWRDNKNRLTDLFIKKIEKIIPDLSKYVALKISATPHTLYKYTFNYKGAAYGWAGTSSQFAVSEFTQKTYIKNLYLTGHWTTLGQGISGVSYLGRSTAKMILNKREYSK